MWHRLMFKAKPSWQRWEWWFHCSSAGDSRFTKLRAIRAVSPAVSTKGETSGISGRISCLFMKASHLRVWGFCHGKCFSHFSCGNVRALGGTQSCEMWGHAGNEGRLDGGSVFSSCSLENTGRDLSLNIRRVSHWSSVSCQCVWPIEFFMTNPLFPLLCCVSPSAWMVCPSSFRKFIKMLSSGSCALHRDKTFSLGMTSYPF